MKFKLPELPLLIAVFVAIVLLFFRLPISKLLNLILVQPVFSQFEPSILKDLFLAALVVTSAVVMAKRQNLVTLSIIALYALIFYFFQRFNPFWDFMRLISISEVTYWDLVTLAFVLPFPLYFLMQRKVIQENILFVPGGFVEDNEVKNIEDDHFKRQVSARKISEFMQLTNNSKSFAIGILGEYGSGKSSFLNLINLNLNDSNILKISFAPWSAGSPEAIRKEFFDQLAKEIAIVDLKISSLLYSYGRRLSNFNNRSRLGLNWFSFLKYSQYSASMGEYEHINRILKGSKCKIVITIDDLDRLYPAEIMEVLKLIRNTANFSNFFYLVGYDKTYVQNAIKSQNEKGQQNYLDKIFQLEIPLPKREEQDIVDSLKKHLKTIISNTHFAKLEDSIIPNGFNNKYGKGYHGMLRQGRDVVRFVNSFMIIYQLIGDEVDFECLILLELIKFRFPQIYELIYEQHDEFLYEMPFRSSHEQYFTPRIQKTEGSTDEVTKFSLYLKSSFSLKVHEVSLLDNIFLKLFNGSSYHKPEIKNSISYPLYFDIYFRYRLSQSDISDKDFKAAIASGNMRDFMNYCASHNLHKELMIRLMQEEINQDRLYFEKTITWIFDFGRTYVLKEGVTRFDYEALINKIYNYQNIITDKLYNKASLSYASFIRSLFDRAIPTYLFENELIYQLKKKGEGFIIPIAELSNYQLTYFTRYADSSHGLNKDVMWIFYAARENYKIPADKEGYYENWRFEPKLAEKMKGYLAFKDPKEFLKFSIDRNISNKLGKTIISQVIEMFDTPLEYRNLIEFNPVLDKEIKSEYLTFFDNCQEKNFKEYIEVEFKTELKKNDTD